jgi:hypothetical protein
LVWEGGSRWQAGESATSGFGEVRYPVVRGTEVTLHVLDRADARMLDILGDRVCYARARDTIGNVQETHVSNRCVGSKRPLVLLTGIVSIERDYVGLGHA